MVRKIALTWTQAIVVVVEEMDRTAAGGTWMKKDSRSIEVVLVSIGVGERKAERGLGSG